MALPIFTSDMVRNAILLTCSFDFMVSMGWVTILAIIPAREEPNDKAYVFSLYYFEFIFFDIFSCVFDTISNYYITNRNFNKNEFIKHQLLSRIEFKHI